MAAVLAFLGTFLLSLFVALLAGLQLADHFRATEKFIAVMLAIAAYTFASVVLLGITYSAARTRGAITAMAWLLALGACILVTVPDGLELYRGRRLEDFTIERKDVEVALQFLVPALLAVLLQWGFVRRRWLRAQGLEDLSRWPWFTTAIAGLAILNPVGLEWVEAALRRPADWSTRQFMALATMAAAAALIVPAFLEYYIRERLLRRRLGSPAGGTLSAAR